MSRGPHIGDLRLSLKLCHRRRRALSQSLRAQGAVIESMRTRFPMHESMERALQSIELMRLELDKLTHEYMEIQENYRLLRVQFHDLKLENAARR